MKYLIIYHKEDNDGVFSGALFSVFIKHEYKDADVELYGADYNDMNQFMKDWPNPKPLHNIFDYIIMTDISFNDIKYIKRLYNEFNNHFIWCDHHKPIIDESYKYHIDTINGIRKTTQSAILNVYEYLYNPFNIENIPEIFRILSAWDSFTFKENGYTLDYVRNINKAITVSRKLNFDEIEIFIEDILYDEHLQICLEAIHDLGKKYNDYDQENIDNIIRTSGDMTWEVTADSEVYADMKRPLSACAIFHQGSSNSLMFKSLQNQGIDIGLVFKHNRNSTWTISMYNINEDTDFHCGDYLKKKYNGGGHKGAAGCIVSQEQFIKILQEKTV